MLVQNTVGALGVGSPIRDAMVDEMVAGARVNADSERGLPLWDSEGFRAGIRDMSAAEMTLEGIAAFFDSDDVRVGPEELALIRAEMGAGTPW